MISNNNILTMDPHILLSLLNMKLRDFYPHLDDLCEDLDLDPNILNERLGSIHVHYDTSQNKFIPISSS